MLKPTVSVIMITYGHEKYIAQAIEGVLMQECDFEVELIIADDCSLDKTETIVTQLKNENTNGSWINYTKHNLNKRAMSNLIWALKQAKGKYIAICEGDDYWTDPSKLQKQVDYLEQNENIAFCFHGSKTINSNNEFGVYFKSKHFENQKKVEKKYFIEKGGGGYCTATSMFKSNLIVDLPSYFAESSIGDLPLALLVISKGDVGYLSDEMSVYRVMADNSWSNTISLDKKIENNDSIYNTIDKFNIHTGNKFIDHQYLLLKTIRYHYCIYQFETSFSKGVLSVIKYSNQLGVINIMRFVKRELLIRFVNLFSVKNNKLKVNENN